MPTGRFSLSWATGGGATRGGWRRRCVVRQQTDSNVARRWFACHLCSIEVSTNLGETSGMAGRRGAMSFRALFCGVGLAGGWCLGVERVSRGFRRGWGRDSGTPCCCVRLAALVFLGCVAPLLPRPDWEEWFQVSADPPRGRRCRSVVGDQVRGKWEMPSASIGTPWWKKGWMMDTERMECKGKQNKHGLEQGVECQGRRLPTP